MKRILDRQLLRDVAAGAAIAALYLPLAALNDILFMKMTNVTPLLVLYAAVTALFLYSKSVRIALGRMILSLPFTILFWRLLMALHFIDRATYWVLHEVSAANNAAAKGIMMLMVFLAVWFGVLIGLFLTGRDFSERVRRILTGLHRIVMPVVSTAILGSILTLSILMPQWDAVSRAVRG